MGAMGLLKNFEATFSVGYNHNRYNATIEPMYYVTAKYTYRGKSYENQRWTVRVVRDGEGKRYMRVESFPYDWRLWEGYSEGLKKQSQKAVAYFVMLKKPEEVEPLFREALAETFVRSRESIQQKILDLQQQLVVVGETEKKFQEKFSYDGEKWVFGVKTDDGDMDETTRQLDNHFYR